MSAFDSVLVANRGEIALRIFRAARGLGLRCIAVHSDADAGAPHVRAADIAARIGPAEAARSYLDIEAIIAAARRTGAEAIHPGYGFLAENAGFAQAVLDAGLAWIGPSPDAIARMGDKATAKRLAREAGVPCLEGHDSENQSDAAFARAAGRIGYPVMVKAAAGGGGRGMRLVECPEALVESLAAARAEAEGAFGDPRLLLERAVTRPRHVEIQLLADAHGNILHLGERDCSVQRRHQKLIEEGPVLDPDLRAAMGEAATRLARAVDYVGAGTVEFLLDTNRQFAFIEMNTRLQVEHAVTEAITGLDLAEWQFRIAQGERLPFTQTDIRFEGHAIEARLCAEDPAADFAPQSGIVAAWRAPEGIRVDHALADGAIVPRHYDTMVARLVAHGRTRDEARRKLANALDTTSILGLPTNRAFLAACLRHPEFAAGPPDTGFLARNAIAPAVPAPDTLALAALLLAGIGPDSASAQIGGGPGAVQRVAVGEATHTLRITPRVGAWHVVGPGVDVTLALHADGTVTSDGLTRPYVAAEADGVLHLQLDGADRRFRRPVTQSEAAGAAASGTVRAPFVGMVRSIAVTPGQAVRAGDTLLVLEAMKVQTRIPAPCDGIVQRLPAAEARDVAAGAVLAVIEATP